MLEGALEHIMGLAARVILSGGDPAHTPVFIDRVVFGNQSHAMGVLHVCLQRQRVSALAFIARPATTRSAMLLSAVGCRAADCAEAAVITLPARWQRLSGRGVQSSNII